MLVVLDIYPAGEQPIEGVTAVTLLEKIRKAGHENALYKKDKGEAIEHIITTVRKGGYYPYTRCGECLEDRRNHS